MTRDAGTRYNLRIVCWEILKVGSFLFFCSIWCGGAGEGGRMITVCLCTYLCTPDKRSNHTIRIYFFIRIYICIGCVALPPPRPLCQQGDAQRATHSSPRRSPPKGRDRDEKGVARKRARDLCRTQRRVTALRSTIIIITCSYYS